MGLRKIIVENLERFERVIERVPERILKKVLERESSIKRFRPCNG